MPSRYHTSRIAQAFRQIDAARARAAARRTSMAMLVAPTPGGTRLRRDSDEATTPDRRTARPARSRSSGSGLA